MEMDQKLNEMSNGKSFEEKDGASSKTIIFLQTSVMSESLIYNLTNQIQRGQYAGMTRHLK